MSKKIIGIAILVLFAATVVMVACFLMSNIEPDVPEDDSLYVENDKTVEMPLYLQDDSRWCDLPYAGGTIGDSGCGLVSMAMAVEYLTGQTMTPAMLYEQVGDTCTTDGLNDIDKFSTYINERLYSCDYRLNINERYYSLDDALAQVDEHHVILASIHGEFGDHFYNGHIVVIYRARGDLVEIRDPKSLANSQKVFEREYLGNLSWDYFYTVGVSE